MTLISVALLNGIMSMLSPEGDTKKYVRFVGSLCLLCALASPIYGLLSDGKIDTDGLLSYPDEAESGYEEIYMNALANGAKENAETAIRSRICETFSLSEDSLDVTLELLCDGGKYSVQGVLVTLNNSAVFADPRDISALVNEICGCGCTVVYG